MMDLIRKIFQGKDHKVIMLCGLFISSIIIYSALTFSAYVVGIWDVFWVKLSVTLILIVLFLIYLKVCHTSMFVIILIIILEIDTSFAILDKNFYDFVSIYPFFIIFGFFFFFRLKTALLMTVGHFIFWAIMVAFRYKYIANHPMFETFIPNLNMFTSSVVVVLLGIFYHISTEVPYEKLEIDDKQKETLLKEIHHRIKNNLNMMASIMGLQILSFEKGYAKDPKEILLNSRLRIEVIAMIHESLYYNKNVEYVNFKSYTKNLTNLIIETYDKKIDVEIDSKIQMLHEEAMLRLGIIINELFTNSIKYAFSKNKTKNRVHISLFEEDQNYIFIYQNIDNKQADIQKIMNSKTLGIKLIKLTVQQIHGVLDVKKEDGLLFTITFPKT